MLLWKQRARGRPAPAAPVRKKVHGLVTRGIAKTSRPSPHNGFNGLFLALRGDEFVLSPSLANGRRRRDPVGRLRLRELDTSNGCQDHTSIFWYSVKHAETKKTL